MTLLFSTDVRSLAAISLSLSNLSSQVLLLALLALLVLTLFLFSSKFKRRRTAAPAVVFPPWDPAQKRESLNKVFEAALKQGQSAIDWYQDNIRTQRLGSRIIRLLAIFLASLGALIPLIGPPVQKLLNVKDFDPQWGYIAFATAAVLLAVDRFYGFSTGWVRYIKTQLALERALTDVRYDWTALVAKLKAPEPTPEELPPMLQRLKDFVDFVHSQIQQETEAWVLEFQTNLSDLMTTVKTQAESTKPGSIQVTITNASDFDPGITALLDQGPELTTQGGQCLFPSVPPGPHVITVRGKKGGKDSSKSEVVKVSPGALATQSVTLPPP